MATKHIGMGKPGHPLAAHFGDRLRQKRTELGLTMTDLAERTGMTPSYVSFIEKGQSNPTLEMMVRLAEAVGLELSTMLLPESPRRISAQQKGR